MWTTPFALNLEPLGLLALSGPGTTWCSQPGPGHWWPYCNIMEMKQWKETVENSRRSNTAWWWVLTSKQDRKKMSFTAQLFFFFCCSKIEMFEFYFWKVKLQQCQILHSVEFLCLTNEPMWAIKESQAAPVRAKYESEDSAACLGNFTRVWVTTLFTPAVSDWFKHWHTFTHTPRRDETDRQER